MDGSLYKIVDGAEAMSVSEVMRLLKQTDWTAGRAREQVTASMRNARCYGIVLKKEGTLAGFARVISDFSTTYYLCDVVVDAACRHQGLGTALVSYIESQPAYQGLRGVLITRDAHAFYGKSGWQDLSGRAMGKGFDP